MSYMYHGYLALFTALFDLVSFQRRQVVVRKENDFYTQLLGQALPVEQQQNLEKQKGQ